MESSGVFAGTQGLKARARLTRPRDLEPTESRHTQPPQLCLPGPCHLSFFSVSLPYPFSARPASGRARPHYNILPRARAKGQTGCSTPEPQARTEHVISETWIRSGLWPRQSWAEVWGHVTVQAAGPGTRILGDTPRETEKGQPGCGRSHKRMASQQTRQQGAADRTKPALSPGKTRDER